MNETHEIVLRYIAKYLQDHGVDKMKVISEIKKISEVLESVPDKVYKRYGIEALVTPLFTFGEKEPYLYAVAVYIDKEKYHLLNTGDGFVIGDLNGKGW